MFFNKYFFAKVGRRKHTGKFLMLQFYKSLLQFYKKQENRPYTRLYGRFSYLRLSTIFLPILSIRAWFKKPICTFLYYYHITYTPPAALSGSASGPCGPFFHRRSGSASPLWRLWEERRTFLLETRWSNI